MICSWLFYVCSELVLSQLPGNKRCSTCSMFFLFARVYTHCRRNETADEFCLIPSMHGTRGTSGTTIIVNYLLLFHV